VLESIKVVKKVLLKEIKLNIIIVDAMNENNKYHIVPTIIFSSNKKIVKRISGDFTPEELLDALKSF
jgi:hypothetical protein